MGGSTMGAPSRQELERIAGLPASEVLAEEIRDLTVSDLTYVGSFAVAAGNLELAEELAQHLFDTAAKSDTYPYNLDCARGYQTIQQKLDLTSVNTVEA